MNELNILLSSAGRRVALVGCFREALSELGLRGKILTIDASLDAPAAHLADGFWQVPPCDNPTFIPVVLDICRRQRVRIVVPTIDTELPVYAARKHLFREVDTTVCVSGLETIGLCADKVCTHRWLVKNGFPTIQQEAADSVLSSPRDWQLPVIVKPRNGSASKGVRRVNSLEELRLISLNETGFLVEEMASGEEHTINVFVDRKGKCLCAVPHRRLEVRAGEVSKALTVKHEEMMELGRKVAEYLPGAYGPLNVQCFCSGKADMTIIEVNARFGGGYPLAHRAGAHFTRWILEEALGLQPTSSFDDWQDDLAMLRYDEAVFLPGREIQPKAYAAAMSGLRS